MRRFRCERCDLLVMPESCACIGCSSKLYFLPDSLRMVACADGAEIVANDRSYRACANLAPCACNWAVPADDPEPLCLSCRSSKVIPDLSHASNAERWKKLEIAKRRVLIGLLSLGVFTRATPCTLDPELSFHFLAEGVATAPVMTGHCAGVITVNVIEADDAERERRRVELGETYRTLVGHLRHELGHFFWERALGKRSSRVAFRTRFGDERADYAVALATHHERGPASDWATRCVSAYASAHPWEDWAETWAHYLHLVDSVETASDGGLFIQPRSRRAPQFEPLRTQNISRETPFRDLLQRWMSLTYVLNELNRGLGLGDAYPFALSSPAIDKLEFVHKRIAAMRRGTGAGSGPRLA